MLTRLALVGGILILTGFAPAPPPRVRPSTISFEKIAGRWILVELRKAGMPEELTQGNELEIEIKDGKYTYFRRKKGSNDVHSMTSTILLDPSQKPCWFDLKLASGEISTRGICALEGDKLTICYTTGPARPVQMEGTDNTVHTMVLMRKKP